MNTEDNLKLQVPRVFYPAFVRAVERCREEGKEMILSFKEKFPRQGKPYIIEIATDNPIDFYYLGKYYATYREEI